MHRSGTSFLARALNLCGTYLGPFEDFISDEFRPSKDNLRGLWENKHILKLSEDILKNNNGSWYDVPENIVINDINRNNFLFLLNKLLEYPSLACGFKDPRYIILHDSLKNDLPKNSKFVGIFRHPLKVAESLKKRQNFSYEKSINLWKIYNEKLLKILEENKGFLFDFDWNADRLISEVHSISLKLGLIENVDLSYWYSENLLHSNKSFKTDYKLPDEIVSLHSKLQKRSINNDKLLMKGTKVHSTKELIQIYQSSLTKIQNQSNYFRNLNDKNLEYIKQTEPVLSKNPWGVLLLVYFLRSDLQETFPEAASGNFTNLVKWAIKYGIPDPKLSIFLKHHEKFYSSFISNLSEHPTHRFLTQEKENQLEKKLVWVFGSPRSGTSWLVQRMLNLPKFNLIWNEPHLGAYLNPKGIGRLGSTELFFSEKHYTSWLPILRKLVLERAYAHGKTLSKNIIIKDPNGSRGSKIVMRCLPSSKLIWLLRDGRDVLDSKIDMHKNDSWNPQFQPLTKDERPKIIKKYSSEWKIFSETVEEAYNKHNPELRLLVKYEDLVQDTFSELKRILEFITVKKDDEEIRKIVERYAFNNIPKDNKGPGKFNRSATPGGWRKNFDDEEIKLINDLMGSTLIKLGYKL